MKHLEGKTVNQASVDCGSDPAASLTTMFVDMVQKGRIQKGQCPALRPVFLKAHSVAYGMFRVKNNLPKYFKVGLFAGKEYPLWARFSSDTLPTSTDYKSTLGIGLKLFDTPTPKIFGNPNDTTFDFILQNMDVFFVDTAKDMCDFTRAGVVDGDYDPYLKTHPKTREIIDAMAKPVGSALASPYWGVLPFACGPSAYVKYKLEPTIDVPPPSEPPTDPSYLADDLSQRLAAGEVTFRFCMQLRTNPETMPLDQATVAWPEEESPFVHVADVCFPMQDVNERNQATYGENLSYNIWRVTEDHAPQGSIAEVRKVVYAASAEERRNVNGIPNGEPSAPRPSMDLPAGKDSQIVRAAIHPGIGIARVGDAESEFFIGPEVTDPRPQEKSGYYRTSSGTLKRQAARFRLYGYNAAGEVVRELTAEDANIKWTVHVANRKAEWFRFITAMDIPETKDLVLIQRNADIKGTDREQLVIDPGSRSIQGTQTSGGNEHKFDTGTFKGTHVYLGELQTDKKGRLLFLSGHGKSVSPSGALPFDKSDPDTFNNADDWYDDMADGPVDAEVQIDGKSIPVEGAWVVSAPPNFAPDVIGWRTMHELMVDKYVSVGWLPVPPKTSFMKDVLPLLNRLSNLQWVNKGFASMFGKGRPMDFNDPELLQRLGTKPEGGDVFQELRRNILNAFRSIDSKVNEPRLWPWLYGDDFDGDLFDASPRTMLSVPALQALHLERWVNGDFIADWSPKDEPARNLSDLPLTEQPAMLDKAALHFCLADAFHPGCEMTWSMRHSTLYSKPFRIRRRNSPEPVNEYGETLNQEQALAPDGPLYGQGPGDITRWMGLPWQGDTAFCRSGYDIDYDPFLPSFWLARVPNQVLTEEDYKIVMDTSQPREKRLAAYNRRASWYRRIDVDKGKDVAKTMEKMIAHFGAQGIVEARPGISNDPDFPETIFVEHLSQTQKKAFDEAAMQLFQAISDAEPGSRQKRLLDSGWGSEEHLHLAQCLRARKRC